MAFDKGATRRLPAVFDEFSIINSDAAPPEDTTLAFCAERDQLVVLYDAADPEPDITLKDPDAKGRIAICAGGQTLALVAGPDRPDLDGIAVLTYQDAAQLPQVFGHLSG